MAREPTIPMEWRETIRDAELDGTAKLVAHTLSTYFNLKGEAFPSQPTLARGASKSDRTIRTATRTLEELGYLVIDRSEKGRVLRYRAAFPASEPRKRTSGSSVPHATEPRKRTSAHPGSVLPEPRKRTSAEVERENMNAADFVAGVTAQSGDVEGENHVGGFAADRGAKCPYSDSLLVDLRDSELDECCCEACNAEQRKRLGVAAVDDDIPF